MQYQYWATVALVGISGSLAAQSTERRLYPRAPRVEHVDTYHGTSVSDPYRWLEDLDSEETKGWIRAQDELTQQYFEALPERDRIEARLRELASVTTYGRATKAGGRYFYIETRPREVGSLYVLDRMDAEPRALVEPFVLFPDGSVSLGIVAPRRDGRAIAYSLTSGTLWHDVRLLDVESGEHYPETLVGMTWRSSIAWTPDHRGFYYMRFDAPTAGSEMTAKPVNGRIMYHRLGTPQSDDRLVYQRSDEPGWLLSPVSVSDDGRYLVFGASGESASGNRLFYRELRGPGADAGAVQELVAASDAAHRFVESDGDRLWLTTTLDAPNGRIVSVDPERPEPARWRELVPESETASLVQAVVAGERLIAWYTEDVKPRLKVYDFTGEHVDDVGLPSITGYIGGGLARIAGTRGDPELFYDFANTAYPSSLFLYDSASGTDAVFRTQEDLPWRPDDVAIRQVFYSSKDGTRIPMFLIHHHDTTPNRRSPTYMPGYGAGGWIMNAGASPLAILLIEAGGLVAIPGLRGGGEYGASWHEAGARGNKPNTFDDYVAGAEWLIDNGYTSAGRIIAQGLSAGGIVPAAVSGMRPELFGVSLPTWPVIEMVRFAEFTGGAYWVSEYGSPEDPKEFEVLFSYSPYHRIVPDTCYPATLVVAGENDQAAVPMHAYKYVAALQHAQACRRPILLDVVWEGGHLPTSSQAPSHFADYLAFASKEIGFSLFP